MNKLEIEYCVVWNYYPRAAGLADELKQHFELDVELVKSSGGRFEISLDGDLIFSKAQTGRFPQPGEIAALIKEKI